MINSTVNTIAIASDHAGVELKAALMRSVAGMHDLGPNSTDSVDYPDYANRLCEWVLAAPGRRGILICGSGIGMSIAANRHAGIRAALVGAPELAGLARQHNDANVLCLGARFVSEASAVACVEVFLNTAFEGGRHAKRVEKLGTVT